MDKGISPVVAVVLLIAVSVVAAVSLYFWAGSWSDRKEPGKPAHIMVRPVDTKEGRFLITNAGVMDLTLSNLSTNQPNVTCSFNGTVVIPSGSSKACYMPSKSGGVTLYGMDTSGRSVAPVTLDLDFVEAGPFSRFILSSSSGASNWWNSSWERRKPLNVSYSGSALTDYAVQVNLSYESEMKADFSDLRFIDSDNSTELDHWLEASNASESVFWVEVPSIPNGGKTIWAYYGNSGASNNSNGTATFDFFDDFSTNTTGEFTQTTWLPSHGDDKCYWRSDTDADSRRVRFKAELEYINNNAFGTSQFLGSAKHYADGDEAKNYSALFQIRADTDTGGDESTACVRVVTEDGGTSDASAFNCSLNEDDEYHFELRITADERITWLIQDSSRQVIMSGDVGESASVSSDFDDMWIFHNYYEEEAAPKSSLTYNASNNDLASNCKRGNTDAELTVDLDWWFVTELDSSDPSSSVGSEEENSDNSLVYSVNDADGLRWVALKSSGIVVQNASVSSCNTFHSSTYSGSGSKEDFSVYYKNCNGELNEAS